MRTDDDQWDITTGVGATALAVAIGRAIETGRDDRLVCDPYARAFVDAAGYPMPDGADDELLAQATYQGVRSRFFDEALTAAVRSGTTQVVLLAAGLDARASRLGWPSEVSVYEVDQAGVLEFKDRVLAGRGAVGGANRVPVAVDLRHDWPGALREAGLDPDRPTAWLAEGLLPYLPADAERSLFERVQSLSAPGSRIAVEHLASGVRGISGNRHYRSLTDQLFGGDVVELFLPEPDGDGPDVWLAAHGWTVTGDRAETLAEGYGRPLVGGVREALGGVELLSADLPGQ